MKLHYLFFSLAALIICNKAQSQASVPTNAISSTDYLGSSTNWDVIFKVGASEKMRLMTWGGLGLGTNSPSGFFHIKSANTSFPVFYMERIIGNKNNLKIDFNANPATGISLGAGSAVFTLGAVSGSSGDFCFMPTPTTQAMVIKNNLTIGVGTTTPLAKFNIHDGALRMTGSVPGFGGPQILWGGDATLVPNGEWGLEYTTATPGREGMNFYRPAGATGSGGNNKLFLGNNGNVGIGTDNPIALFTVNGKTLIGDPGVVTSLPGTYNLYVQNGILTERVKVAVNGSTYWADYVFDKDYKLRSLEEVEKFIQDNHHLPEVPTTAEVKEQGVDLGEMDVRLLKKVEELTLYVIDLKKKLDEQNNEIEKLKGNASDK